MLSIRKVRDYLMCCSSSIADGLNENTFFEDIDPFLVFRNNKLFKVREGVSFIVKGKILPNCERFSINFLIDTPNEDIALHINPRLPQNYIVRNCRIRNVWGAEEVTSCLPFTLHRGENFSIQILVTEICYLISIGGRHFASFSHRLPYNRVKCLEVKGDVDNITVDQIIVTEYPEILSGTEPKLIKEILVTENLNSKENLSICEYKQNHPSLEMPYYGILPTELINGKCLRIEGRVKILPHSFFINIQKGHKIWPHPIISLHLNPRFANYGGKHIICRNSWIANQWLNEERTEEKIDFMPGKHFSLCINCTETAYEILLNGKFIAEYKYRINPEMVDTVYLQGDIKLWDICLEKSPIFTESNY